jgi:hypothetical protein
MWVLKERALKYLRKQDFGGRDIEFLEEKVAIDGNIFVSIKKCPSDRIIFRDEKKIVFLLFSDTSTIMRVDEITLEITMLGDRKVCFAPDDFKSSRTARLFLNSKVDILLLFVGDSKFSYTEGCIAACLTQEELDNGFFKFFEGKTFLEGVEDFLEEKEVENKKRELRSDVRNLKERLLRVKKALAELEGSRELQHSVAQVFRAKRDSSRVTLIVQVPQIIGVRNGVVEIVKEIDYPFYCMINENGEVYVHSVRSGYPHPHCQGSYLRHQNRKYYQACLGAATIIKSYMVAKDYDKAFTVLVQYLGQADLKDRWGESLLTAW